MGRCQNHTGIAVYRLALREAFGSCVPNSSVKPERKMMQTADGGCNSDGVTTPRPIGDSWIALGDEHGSDLRNADVITFAMSPIAATKFRLISHVSIACRRTCGARRLWSASFPLVLTGACQFGHGAGRRFTSNFIHSPVAREGATYQDDHRSRLPRARHDHVSSSSTWAFASSSPPDQRFAVPGHAPRLVGCGGWGYY